jgi:hypothetical protein
VSYARNTTVTEDRSRQEIERLLMKYGASRFGCMSDYEHRIALIEFTYQRIVIEMRIPLPDASANQFARTPTGLVRSETEQNRLYQQEVRRRWRSLSLALKAKLIAIEDGITTFENEFMPYMITDDGRTLGERFMHLIATAQKTGRLCLPAPAKHDDVIDVEAR